MPPYLFSRTLVRLASNVWLALVVAGVVVLLVPEAPKEILAAPDGWQAIGRFFENSRPGRHDVSTDIVDHPGARFFRSWSPDSGVGQGRLASPRFDAPAVLAIPIYGFARQPGVAIYLERLDSLETLPVVSGNAPATWTERTLWLPRSWVNAPVRLVVETSSRTSEVGLGSPFRSSFLSWLKESVVVVTAIHFLGFILLLCPGTAAVLLLRKRNLRGRPHLIWAVPLTLLAGYVCFFLFYYVHAIAAPVVLALVLASLVVSLRRHRDLLSVVREDRLTWPLFLFFALSLYYCVNLFAADSGVGTWSANLRYEPPTWSSDNQLPQLVAEGVYQQLRPSAILPGSWLVSDRPPLMSGFLLLTRPITEFVLLIGDNRRLAYLFFQVLGIVASTFWVMPVYRVARRLLVDRRGAQLLVVAFGLSGFAIFNASYISPKLLAASMALLACEFAGLWDRKRAEWQTGNAVASAFAAGLAFLSHAGVIFGLIACGPYLVARWRRHLPLRQIGLGVCVGAVLLAPWSAWQSIENPPGNALAKYAFSGTYGFEDPEESVWEAVREHYSTLTWQDWLSSRVSRGLIVLGMDRSVADEWIEESPEASGVGRLRGYEGLLPIASLGVANLGWLALAWTLVRRGSADRWNRRRLLTIGIGGTGILLSVLTTWTFGFVHEQSYLSVVLVWLGLMAEGLSLRGIVRSLTLLSCAAYFVIVWQVSPLLAKPVRGDFIPMLLGCLLIVAAAGCVEERQVERVLGPRSFAI